MELLWLVPAMPLAGFLVLALFGSRLSTRAAAVIGPGAIGVSAVAAAVVAWRFIVAPPPDYAFTQVLWAWVTVDGFAPRIAFYLDALTVVMMLVVTWVGFLIHVYSVAYMKGDESYTRFFAYMNLFVASMLILVLADNLVLLYLGWEGVGLCSYLLIGFWYKNSANGAAAMKAFLVTRIGDTAMAIGLFLLFTKLGTLDIQELMHRAAENWPVGSGLAIAASLLLLGGAVGKSGQLPLQVWLPDAMAGPTPVSALIHAATMVTAGMYLIARTHVIFELAPPIQFLVGLVGATTLLLAGFSALAQHDIKRVLAYSTISQIGYMFLALGAGAYSAAIFHFMTHAFFKALLFMAAGAVILAMHHEQDMFKMGGLRKQLPLVFWTFLIGAMSLASLPLITAGFYSKDLILWDVWISGPGGKCLWAAGWIGAFLTGVYTFRMVFITFFGEAKHKALPVGSVCLYLPLVVLALATTFAGFLELPRTLGHWPVFSHFIGTAFEHAAAEGSHGEASVTMEMTLQIVAGLTALAGLATATVLFLLRPQYVARWTDKPNGAAIHRLLESGFGFDAVYDRFVVRPFVTLARAGKDDFVDLFYNGLAGACQVGNRSLSFTQTGHVRWYMMGIAVGAVITIAIAVFL
ncbi:MAG: NADH-quinone oxidoreductase subunit [Candidatus Hydrogenedentes bacterium]|nr:NADH-quinone oxidoreductase subunit [Candidatus Hydrogenedentota bacterium]